MNSQIREIETFIQERWKDAKDIFPSMWRALKLLCENRPHDDLIKEYLEKYAQERQLSFSEQDFDKIKRYCEIVESAGYELMFKDTIGTTSTTLNGTIRFKKKKIIVTPQWAVQLVFEDTIETRNAFEFTIGHELAHAKDISCLKNGIVYRRLTRVLNEFRADFNAITELDKIDGIDPKDNDLLADACRYKRDFKINKSCQKDKYCRAHPPWSRRIEAASEGKFDSALVELVAKDLHYNLYFLNWLFFPMVIKNYSDKEIILPKKSTAYSKSR